MEILYTYELEDRDKLTGLFNRDYFFEIIDTYIMNAREKDDGFSIVILDIEGFSEFNNSLGYSFGDEILIKLSNEIRLILDEDYPFGRLGGDEFAFLFRTSNKKSVVDCIEKILDRLHAPLSIESKAVHIKLNIGVSRYPQNGNTVESLIKSGHIATYKAKKQGVDRISFYCYGMYDEIDEKFNITNYLFDASKNNELYIAYQPIVDINKKNIIGAEALLRWENPFLGNVKPDKFIPIAEETGQIHNIGNWVIEEVCRQVSIWKGKSYQSIIISINISIKQLEQESFCENMLAILKEYKVKPSNIELEITEGMDFADATIVSKNLSDLKKAGFTISIDDFGTGFSSLEQLYLLEPDTIKIDKVFIDDIVSDLKSRYLVKLIIDMAKSLNLSVAAEGIETNEQLCQLKELGCHLGQGYYFSKPLLADEMGCLLR